MSDRLPNKEEQDIQFEEWKSSQAFEEVDTEEVKESLISELEFLSKMSVEEYTLWRKWREIQEKYPVKKITVNPFFVDDKEVIYHPYLLTLKDNIWIPESPEDYKKLQPTLILANGDKRLTSIWQTLRIFIHTQHNNRNIGRNLLFVSVDKITGKYLGIIACSSDFMDLTPRDKYIGWTREQRTDDRMINHTTIGSTIVPTQPLGYNFLGGKLLALLIISNVVEDVWNSRYSDKLVGITTTSLYGSFSQYQRLRYWTKRGHSAGSIRFEPSSEKVNLAKKWLKYYHPQRYWEWYKATSKDDRMPLKRDYKQRSLAFIYRQLDIDKSLIETNHQRGIYFCPLFKNTNEFLRQEINEDKLERKFDNNIESLVDIWKENYAKKRINQLIKDGRYNTEVLFYHGIIGKSWEETREKYLREVGR